MTHVAFDLDAAESALMARLFTLQNTATTPAEPLLRSVFNIMDEAMSDDETPRRLPGCGILDDDDAYAGNRLMGGHVAQEGRIKWKLLVLCDAPTRGGGMRGPRGAAKVSKQLIEGIVDPDDGWQISNGVPMQLESRRRYNVRDENGELIPIAGYVVEVSHPTYYE